MIGGVPQTIDVDGSSRPDQGMSRVIRGTHHAVQITPISYDGAVESGQGRTRRISSFLFKPCESFVYGKHMSAMTGLVDLSGYFGG
jgi:hypothetical protein